MKNVYTDQHQRTAFEFAKETGVGINFYKMNENLVEDIIKKPWALDGKNFSDRIWSDKEKLINTLHTEMTQGFIRGDSLEDITKRITAKMNVSKSNVKRLVRTESAAYRSKAQLKAFQDLEVEKYQVLATLDSRTSDICQDMDLKVFDLKDYEIGTTAPPFHVNCRSVTIPYFDEEEEGERTARDSETGKTIYVSDKMTYKEWKQKFLMEKNQDTLDGVVGNVILAPHIVKVLESEFGKLNGNDVILREERLEHIRERHPEVADLVKEKYKEIIENPDYILKDSKNEDTIILINTTKKGNLNTVIKLSLNKEHKNSVITFYKTRQKYVEKLLDKNKILLKKKEK